MGVKGQVSGDSVAPATVLTAPITAGGHILSMLASVVVRLARYCTAQEVKIAQYMPNAVKYCSYWSLSTIWPLEAGGCLTH